MEKEKIDWLSDALSSGPEPGEESGQTPELESWLHEQPDNGRLYDTLRRIEVTPRIQEYAGQMRDRIWLELNERIDRASRRVFWLRSAAAAAAVLFLLLVSNYFSYREGYKLQNSQLVSLENPRGMRSSVTLSDGTKVTLNGGTILTYPTAFVADEREVEVEGEAFFEVEHDGEHPFIVKAGEVRVRVLGTKFNVKAYDEEDDIEVVLTEGKIGIGLDADKPVIRMEPEQLVRFDKTSRTFAKQQVDQNLYTSWIDGKFYSSRHGLSRAHSL